MEPHVSTSSPSWPYLETALSKMDVEKEFILAWKTYPALWDTGHQHYTNKHKRLEYLKKLLEIYKKIKRSATTDDVRRKINIFRSNYKRELNKIEMSRMSGQPNEYIYSPRVWYFPLLHFLIEPKTIKRTQETSDFKKLCSKVSSEPSPNKLDHAPYKEESGSENSSEDDKPIKEEIFFPVIQHLEEPMFEHENVRKKRKSVNQNERINCNSLLSESRSLEQTNPQAFIWAEKLNKLCPLQKLYAEKAINDILFEAELGTLDRFSVQINSGSKSYI